MKNNRTITKSFALTLSMFKAGKYSELTRNELLNISQFGCYSGDKFIETEAAFYAERAQR